MARRILITGGSGFVGQWLCRALLEHGHAVFAGTIEGPPPASVGILDASQRDAVCWLTLNVGSDDDIRRAIERARPEAVVHLAGIAFPPEANANPVQAFDVNALGAVRLLAELANGANQTRVLVVGSAEQYGAHVESEQPLTEDARQMPLSVYAASKASQEMFALLAGRASPERLAVICTRSFNHSGRGHPAPYLLPSLVRRARELPKRGARLPMGNTTPIRDYLHVADVVDAYVHLLERGESGTVYNVSSGRGVSVKDLATRVMSRLGIEGELVTDPALVRAADVPILVGANERLRRATGWAPRRSVDDIIDDLINATSR